MTFTYIFNCTLVNTAQWESAAAAVLSHFNAVLSWLPSVDRLCHVIITTVFGSRRPPPCHPNSPLRHVILRLTFPDSLFNNEPSSSRNPRNMGGDIIIGSSVRLAIGVQELDTALVSSHIIWLLVGFVSSGAKTQRARSLSFNQRLISRQFAVWL